MFERFTENARQATVLSREESVALGHDFIDVAHLDVALLRTQGVGARALRMLGIDAEKARAALIRRLPATSTKVSGQIPFTPRLKTALELALREAIDLGHVYIGTEHVLLGAMREEERAEDGLLLDLRLDYEQIRVAVERLLVSRPPPDVAKHGMGFPELRVDPGRDDLTEPAGDDEVRRLRLEAVPTHADRPARQDELGRARLAEVLAERIRRVRCEDTEVPVTTWSERRRKLRRDRTAARRAGSFMVHVHAPWGAGKSSLLNFLSEDLRNRQRLRWWLGRRRPRDERLSRWLVVEFSAWEHQRLDPPWWWLLAAIRRSALRELWRTDRGRCAWFLIRDLAWRLWNSRVAWITVALVGVLVLLGTSLDWFGLEGRSLRALQSIAASVSVLLALGTTLWGRLRGTSRWLAIGSAEGAAKFLRRAHDPLGVYRGRFRWLVRSADRPIAVLIDDLDRCRPEYVVGLLEGIQTLFMGEPVTYVVAADRTWLCESFASVYGAFETSVGEPGRPLGYLFLEKTFQVSMEIPPMTFEDRRRYWRTLTTARASRADGPRETEAHAAVEKRFADARTNDEIEHLIGELLAARHAEDRVLRAAVRRLNAPELQTQLEDLLGPFALLLENNPRSMKRLVNAYGIERDRLLREGRLPRSEYERRQLVLFTILRLRWPRFAEHLLRQPEEAERCTANGDVADDHPYGDLFCESDVCALFDGSLVDAKLDADVLRRYAGREPLQSPSVGV